MLFTPIIFLVEPKFDTLFLSTGKYNTFQTAARAHFSASSKIWSWRNGDIYEKNTTYVLIITREIFFMHLFVMHLKSLKYAILLILSHVQTKEQLRSSKFSHTFDTNQDFINF